MSATLTAVERARIFRFVLDRPQGEVSTRIEELVVALQTLLASSAADPTRGRVHEGRWTTINARTEHVEAARAAIAKATGGTT